MRFCRGHGLDALASRRKSHASANEQLAAALLKEGADEGGAKGFEWLAKLFPSKRQRVDAAVRADLVHLNPRRRSAARSRENTLCCNQCR